MSIARTARNRELLDRISAIIGEQEDRQGELSHAEASRLEAEKWELVHELLRSCPFPTRERLRRSDQWREAYQRIRDIGERELMDWVLLQVEVAANIERGVREMRPRKAGPCHPQILEYARQRMVKARKIVDFVSEGEKEGLFAVDAKWHSETERILKKSGRKYQPYDHGGHEDIPWPVNTGRDDKE